jgi:hypothetical protein
MGNAAFGGLGLARASSGLKWWRFLPLMRVNKAPQPRRNLVL